MNKKVLAIISVVIIFLIGIVVFVDRNHKFKGNEESIETIKVVDGDGEKEVKKNPKTVAVFDYGVVDILENLEIEVNGLPKGSLPKALDKYKDDKYKDLGDLKEPNFEELNALKPDLIIISGRQKDLYDKFNEIAPTLYFNVDGKDYLNDFTRNLTSLGKIFNKEDLAKNKLEEIKSDIESLNKEIKDKVLVASTFMVSEGNLSAFSNESRFGFIYNELGFKNGDESLESSNHGQQVNFEYILEKNPEYIFVIDKNSAIGNEESSKALFDNEIIKKTKAFKENKIVYLNSQAWYVISGGIDSTKTMIKDIKEGIK